MKKENIMKSIKKILAVLMSLTLVVGSLVFVESTKADITTDEWKDSAVITPAENSLVGAGYIDVEFDASLSGYTYEVLLDDQPVYWRGNSIVNLDLPDETTSGAITKSFPSGGKVKTEVYTNKVKAHTIKIKASKSGEQDILSNPKTFYVSKKGLAMGADMGSKIQMKKFNCSWYYNWGTEAFNNSIDEEVAHMPMMWGAGEESVEGMSKLSESKSNYIMGFNEPDIGHQANMNSILGLRAWKQYISPLSMRKVSPAPADPNGASGWISDFLNGVWGTYNEDGDIVYLSDFPNTPYDKFEETGATDCDAVALHYYKGKTDIDELCTAIERTWNAFHKPIWVTEVSVMGRKNSSYDYSYEIPERREEVKQFLINIANRLDNMAYVERYCWFPYDISKVNELDHMDGSGATALFSYDTGAYTEAGVTYSEAGNPSGYQGYSITEDEMYKPEETTTQASTTKKTTTQSASTQNLKPGVIKLKKPKNVKKKSVKLSWSKANGATKYQLQYALNKTFTKKVVTKKTSKTSFKVTKLKKKKKYFFRVRGVNKAGFGAWSNIKSIKIKK